MLVDVQTAPHYTWGDRCDSWVLLESGGLSVKQEKMPPGTREQRHVHHLAQQFFYVLKGTAVFYMEDQRVVVHGSQGMHIPPHQRHYIANESETELEFLVISQPSTQNDRINS